MTGKEYREQHGDPAQWTDDEYEVFNAVAKPADRPPAPADFQPAA